MVELEHGPEPVELKRFRGAHPGATWESDAFHAVRSIVRAQLHREQGELCVYCEGKVAPNGGHIDHIKPRAAHPEKTFVYENLAHSCSAEDHCGHAKADRPLAIEPGTGCNRYFSLAGSTGKLLPAPGLTTEDHVAAQRTIDILGLNRSPALVRQRLEYFNIIRGMPNPEDQQAFLSTAPYRWSLKGVIS